MLFCVNVGLQWILKLNEEKSALENSCYLIIRCWFAAPLYACTKTANIAKHRTIYGEAVPFCSNCHVVRKSEELIVLKMC
jgi:Zn-finger protein